MIDISRPRSRGGVECAARNPAAPLAPCPVGPSPIAEAPNDGATSWGAWWLTAGDTGPRLGVERELEAHDELEVRLAICRAPSRQL